MKKVKNSIKFKNRKKERFNLIKEYKKSFRYIYDSKNFIYTIILIFLIFSLFGFFVPASDELTEKIYQFIEDLVKQTEDFDSSYDWISFIFLNNLHSSFIGMVSGIFPVIFPVIFSIVNAYILGFVALITVNNEGFFVLWRLFPHGIFELPAIFISLGLGLKIGTFIFQKEKINSFREYIVNSLKTFILIIIPLLIIAAIIEGTLIFLAG